MTKPDYMEPGYDQEYRASLIEGEIEELNELLKSFFMRCNEKIQFESREEIVIGAFLLELWPSEFENAIEIVRQRLLWEASREKDNAKKR